MSKDQPLYQRLATRVTQRFSPLSIVLTISGLILLASFLIRYYTQAPMDPRVRFNQYQGREVVVASPPRKVGATDVGADDPSVRYADRLRDASALAISFSLYVLNDRLVNKRVLTDLHAALEGLSASSLLPPGMAVISGGGVVRSPAGLFYIRYRPNPYGLEVLSVGARGFADGEVFIIRLPEAGPHPNSELAPSVNAGGYATLFVAPRSPDALIPKPFVPAASFAAAGWTEEALRAAPYSPQQVQELKSWFATYQSESQSK